MIKKIGLLVGVLGIIVGGALSAGAQGQEPEFVTGIIQEVSPTGIKVNTYYSDEENGTAFKITDTTVFENVGSINDIAVGDEVYVDYLLMDGVNTAVNVYKMAVDDGSLEEGAAVPDEDLDEGASADPQEVY